MEISKINKIDNDKIVIVNPAGEFEINITDIIKINFNPAWD